MGFDVIKRYFANYNNDNDIVHLVDKDTDEVFWSGKIRDINNAKQVDRHVVGFAARHFQPKVNQYVDGLYLYVRRIFVL